MKDEWIEKIEEMHPCVEALDWCRTQPDYSTAWRTCERGDWMLWLLGQLSGPPESASRKKLVLTACACGRLALPYAGKSKQVAQETFETAEAWARGEGGVSLADVEAAGGAARAAAYAAAYAAARAAYATDAAAHAAACAVSAASAVAYAAARAAASAARAAASAAARAAAYAAAYAAASAVAYRDTLRACADIVRQFYPEPPELGKGEK